MIVFPNGHKSWFFAASGAMAWLRGWPWEQPLRLVGVYDPTQFTVITKTLTLKPLKGNLKLWPPWAWRRCIKFLGGGNVVNAVGLTNIGLPVWLTSYYGYIKPYGLKVVVSLQVENLGEIDEAAKLLNPLADIVGVELNVSCAAAGTVISKGSRLCRIEDAVTERTGKVLSEYGRTDCGAIVSRGRRQTVSVKTDTGNIIHVTPEHHFLVWASEGFLKWKRADKLTDNDYLLAGRGAPPRYAVAPDTMLWNILGHLYGDGWRYKRGSVGLVANVNELESLTAIRNYLDSIGVTSGLSYRPPRRTKVKRTEGEWRLIFNWLALSDKLPDFIPRGMWRSSGIPPCVFGGGYSRLAAFLRGLFSTDGGVTNKCRISFTTKHRRLVRDVQQCLLQFGIISKLTKSARRTPFGLQRIYQLRTLGVKSVVAFAEHIGFNLRSKTKALNKIVVRRLRLNRDTYLGIPDAAGLINQLFPPGSYMGGRNDVDDPSRVTINRIKRGATTVLAESMAARILRRITVTASPNAVKLLSDYITNGWWFDQVVRVRHDCVDREVFDVIDSSTSSYLTNWLVSHNCPNVSHPGNWCDRICSLTGAFLKACHHPTLLKLGYQHDFVDICQQLDGRVCAFDLINAVPWDLIYPNRPSPLAKHGLVGAVSGPAIVPYARAALSAVKSARIRTQILSGGGITSLAEIHKRYELGADGVALGSHFMTQIHKTKQLMSWLPPG